MIDFNYAKDMYKLVDKLENMDTFGDYTELAGVHCDSVNKPYPKKNYYYVYHFGEVVYSGKKFPNDYHERAGYVIQKRDLNFDDRDIQRKVRYKRLELARNNYMLAINTILSTYMNNYQVEYIIKTSLNENYNKIDQVLHDIIVRRARDYSIMTEAMFL